MKTYGPYLRKDNRLIVVIVNDDKTKTSKSYPKILLEEHIGRELIGDETVDHIDGNPLNNSLDNLRILSRSENARVAIKPAEMIDLECLACGIPFQRRKKLFEYERKRGKVGPYCSHRCVGRTYH